LLAERVEGLRDTAAYRCFERVREEVLRMKDAEVATSDRPSAYWQEELGAIEYVLDASPLVIEKLRHHIQLVTGVRPYDYRRGADEKQTLFEEKLAALRAIGDDALLVPEAELLGGFGFEIDGALYNIDTLKFYEAFIALDAAGLLAQFHDGRDRQVVLEIGSGWGGFAYQLKTLFPETCYVLVDLPELFLFSAVYLLTAFPEARVSFWRDDRPVAPYAIDDYDFVFVPHTSFDNLELDRIDLAINMVSFQEMTTEQVQRYVDRLHAIGCPHLYSLNRDRSPYNRELTSVREILATRYDLREIAVLPVPYTKLMSRAELAERRPTVPGKSSTDYRHVVGARSRRSARGNWIRAALGRR
jgi:hypothetical protein